jgi:capsule polysaccharide export protein KpsE/RkpR
MGRGICGARTGLSELRTSSDQLALAKREPDELLLEAADEQALRAARERNAARVRVLWHNRRLLLRAVLLGLALSTVIAFLIPKRYTSAARLMPPDEGSGQGAAMLAALAGRTAGTLTSLAASALGMKTTGDLFIGVLKSDTVQDDIIQKFNLQRLYHDTYVEDAREDLATHTRISEDAKSGIITVEVTDHNPRRSAAITQEYVNELNWVVNNLSTSSAHRERVFLDQRLDQVRSQLEGDEKQFSQFASQKGAIDIAEQGKAMVTAAATLQGQLIAAESELEGLRQVYTDNNVRVRSLQARVNNLHTALEKIGGKGTDENSSAGEVYPSLRQLPLLGVEYADLLRRTKVQEAVFEALTQEDELAKVEEAKETPSVKVLDPPRVPDKKSFPPRLLIMTLGTFLPFVSGIAWVLANSAWAAVDPNDPHKTVAVEVWSDVRSSLPWNSRNGSPNGEPKHWLRNKFRSKKRNESGE